MVNDWLRERNQWLREHNRQVEIRRIRAMEQEEGGAAVALGEAVRYGLVDEILRLLDDGADINAKREYDGITPLMLAYDPKIAKLLIDRGADVNARCDLGKTPLLWFLGGVVAKRTAEKHIRTLLAAGADVSIRSPDGDTPQALAAKKYDPEIAKLLEPK